jgi:hypothetical protein
MSHCIAAFKYKHTCIYVYISALTAKKLRSFSQIVPIADSFICTAFEIGPVLQRPAAHTCQNVSTFMNQ